MKVFGNMRVVHMTVTTANVEDNDLSSIVSTEKLLKIIPNQDVYLLLTPTSSTDDADVTSHLLKANIETEWFIGRGLDRISVFNNSGSTAGISVAVLY